MKRRIRNKNKYNIVIVSDKIRGKHDFHLNLSDYELLMVKICYLTLSINQSREIDIHSLYMCYCYKK